MSARQTTRRPKNFLKSRDAATIGMIGCVAVIVVLVAFMAQARIAAHEGTYVMNDGAPVEFELPLRVPEAETGDAFVRFIVRLGAIRPTHVRIVPDDCLETLEINGETVTHDDIPLCDFTKGAVFDLSDHLRRGDNVVIARVRNGGGDLQFSMTASARDPIVTIPATLIVIAFVCLGALALKRFKLSGTHAGMFALFGLATLVRFIYMLSTPHWIRGHDTDGHIEYIDHIAKHAALPNPIDGWEFWQPPLYYVFGGLWMRIAETVGLTRADALFGLQFQAFLLSVATLAIIVWIGVRLFPESRDRGIALPLFFSLIAFFPGLIYLSARINNDVLCIPLAFLAGALIIEWWRTGSGKMWALLMLAIALHILTKNNGLLLLPVAYGCLALKKGIGIKRMTLDGALGVVIVLLVAGWFSAYRMSHDTGQDFMVGNTGTLNSALLVRNDVEAFTAFNPGPMIASPYNNPWDDASGRNHFWEYRYRSGFFGEFDHGADHALLASLLLALSFSVLFAVIIGFCSSILRLRTLAPLVLIGVLFPLGHAAFRFAYPYGSSQDYRYSLLTLVPWAFFAVVGLLAVKSPLLRTSLRLCMQAFVVLCIAFTTTL